MLFHMSIAGHDPRRIATVIAELWGGEALRFPAVTQGSWVALAGDARSTILEVYPIDTVLKQAEGDADAYGAPARSRIPRRMARSRPISTSRRCSLSPSAKAGRPNIAAVAGYLA